ncbi:hypothetical protein [Streptomyces sp. NPDC005507]|uniref:hypothetical protein n=1 Tax=Streptomyces sp. NPDC005507 TaxID=3154885 RepID=UPI0033BE0FE8
MTLQASSVDYGGSFFLDSGQIESTALQAVHHDTLSVPSVSRRFLPPRWSRRGAAYSSAFDICAKTRAFHQGHPDAARASTPVLSKLVNNHPPWIGVPPKPVNNRLHNP